MALSGTATGFDGPVVPDVNINRKGSSAPRITGANSPGWRASSSAKSRSSRPADFAPTTMAGGAPGTSSSFGRFATSVTTRRVRAVSTRCSIALGPKAVKSGW